MPALIAKADDVATYIGEALDQFAQDAGFR
jgi:hypothetical protein